MFNVGRSQMKKLNIKNSALKTAQKNLQTSLSRKKSQAGVALLEALIAITIFSVGILGIAGLQAAMIKGTTESKNRADASMIAQKRIAQMWADPANLASFVETNTVLTELPTGRRTTIQGATAGLMTVNITWQEPGEPTAHKYGAEVRIVGAT